MYNFNFHKTTTFTAYKKDYYRSTVYMITIIESSHVNSSSKVKYLHIIYAASGVKNKPRTATGAS